MGQNCFRNPIVGLARNGGPASARAWNTSITRVHSARITRTRTHLRRQTHLCKLMRSGFQHACHRGLFRFSFSSLFCPSSDPTPTPPHTDMQSSPFLFPILFLLPRLILLHLRNNDLFTNFPLPSASRPVILRISDQQQPKILDARSGFSIGLSYPTGSSKNRYTISSFIHSPFYPMLSFNISSPLISYVFLFYT